MFEPRQILVSFTYSTRGPTRRESAFTVEFTVRLLLTDRVRDRGGPMETGASIESDRLDRRLDRHLELVARVAGSSCFQKSPRLRQFLLYVCECALQNRAADLHEQPIGCKVFNRRADYNPSEDNIVRVEARKLRRHLEEYFTGEGRDEPVVIEIPKGGYVPVFKPRALPAVVASVPEGVLAVPVVETAKPRRELWTRPGTWMQPAIIILLAIVCLWLWNRERALQRISSSASPTTERPDEKPDARNALWSAIFNNERQTTVVCADATVVLVQNMLHRSLSLSDYVGQTYLPALSRSERLSKLAIPLVTKQYTSMADVHLVERMLLLNYPYWSRTVVKSARNMQLSDFKTGNFVLLGSKRAIPWNELFEPRLNFRFEFDEARHIPLIRNKSPHAGEQAEYANAAAGQPGEAYSTVALVPNLSYSGYVLIVNGTSMEATEAAGEYMTNPAFASTLLKTVGFESASKPAFFEVLLTSSTLAGSSSKSEIVAYRVSREAMHP